MEDPASGGPKDKTWLSKSNPAFGAGGNAAGALVLEEEKASEKASEIEAPEVIKHHQKKMRSAHFEEEAAVIRSKDIRENSLPHSNDVSLINSSQESDKEILVRDAMMSCSYIFVGTLAS
jgi:hypothetical protein